MGLVKKSSNSSGGLLVVPSGINSGTATVIPPGILRSNRTGVYSAITQRFCSGILPGVSSGIPPAAPSTIYLVFPSEIHLGIPFGIPLLDQSSFLRYFLNYISLHIFVGFLFEIHPRFFRNLPKMKSLDTFMKIFQDKFSMVLLKQFIKE